MPLSPYGDKLEQVFEMEWGSTDKKGGHMNNEERRRIRIQHGTKHMSADERRAMQRAVRTANRLERGGKRMVRMLGDIAAARGRAERRRESDRRTDAKRRYTISAHVSLALYERVKDCAEERGGSMYKFVVDAVLAALAPNEDERKGGG